jgi:hypothetical protein
VELRQALVLNRSHTAPSLIIGLDTTHIQAVFGSIYDRKQVIIKLSRFVKRQLEANCRQPTKVQEKMRLARSRDQGLNVCDMRR